MEQVHQQVRSLFIEGSQARAEGVPYSEIAGKFVVVEEKPDGFPVTLSFRADGHPIIESESGAFAQWVETRKAQLFERLGARFRLHGQWLQIKRTRFYDLLPDNFLESDVLDLEQGSFISTSARQALLDSLPVKSVPVLRRGIAPAQNDLSGLLGPSRLQSLVWRERLQQQAERGDGSFQAVLSATDDSAEIAELTIKIEGQGVVKERYRFVRPGYVERENDGPAIANLLDVAQAV